MIAKQGEDKLEPKLGREGLGCQGKEFGLQREDDREALEGCKQKCHPEILRLEGISDGGVDNGWGSHETTYADCSHPSHQ